MGDNLTDILIWWNIFFAIGLIFFPFTAWFFSSFWDKGYIFAKIIGILLITLISWWLINLRLMTFDIIPLLFVVIMALALNCYIAFREKTSAIIRQRWKIILGEELLFALALIFWSFVRSAEPSIHSLEKFMDFGFVNSILRADYFPPKDMWLTPHSINYYYFGHLVTAVITKLSGINPAVAYNLMIATLFALTLSASFSIGFNLYQFFLSSHHSQLDARRYTLYATLSGLLSSFLVSLGGNLHTIYTFFQSYSTENPVPFWQLPLSWNISGYWYPNATRFIPFTIHEFPLYSFVVSDLHGHVLNIPFVLLTIAIVIRVFHQGRLLFLDSLLLGLLIGTSLMTNVLDGPIYLLVLSLLILALYKHQTDWLHSLSLTLKSIAAFVAIALLASLPFWIAFKPFSSGIGVICAPQFLINLGHLGPFLFEADHCTRSPLWMLSMLWGFPLAVFLGFLVLNFKLLKELKFTDFLVLALTLIAFLLILIPEFFYVKDIYPAHYRANTVFKFGYQAFIILGLSTGYMLTRLLTSKKTFQSYIVNCTLLILFFLVVIYPYFAVNSYYGGLKTSRGLDGLSYLNDLYPADYRAIAWFNANLQGQPVILEGVGDSYTDYARISSNTGLPTVVGWPVHEWLWRGSYDEAGKRTSEVATIYESPDPILTEQLIHRYNISYVYIGDLERQKYPNLNENKFYNLGKVVFKEGNTKIYQLNR